jgi:4-hydroxy-3-methylbut-2-enyl diphosphate reductase
MKLSIAAAFLLSTASNVSAFGPQVAFRVSSCSNNKAQEQLSMSTTTDDQKSTSSYNKGTKKQERRRIMASDSFHRMGFKDVREKASETMKQEYQSELVADLKSNNFVMERDGVRVHLAKVRCRRHMDRACFIIYDLIIIKLRFYNFFT